MAISVDHYHFPSVDSTNTWAKTNASHLRRERLTVVSADMQTAGRGRHKRHWVSPPEVNLYVSYCLFLPTQRKDIANLAQIVALTTAQVIQKHGLPSQLKWPNDILINGNKVGGILCETTPVEEHTCVIVGLGLNINMNEKQLQEIADKEATSLAVEAGHPFDVATIAEELESAIRLAIKTYLKHGFKPFLDSFREMMMHRLGDTVRFHVNGNIIQGSFHSINADGALDIILDDRQQTFHSGEMV